MFHDFDPYQKLEELFMRSITQEHNLDTVHDQVKQVGELLEQMADQLRHLTRAVQGLQEQNKILHSRLLRLEGQDD